MKISINYISRKHYKDASDGLKQWKFFYRKYSKIVKGFHLRILGVHVFIREKNATEKLIAAMKK